MVSNKLFNQNKLSSKMELPHLDLNRVKRTELMAKSLINHNKQSPMEKVMIKVHLEVLIRLIRLMIQIIIIKNINEHNFPHFYQ